MNQWICSDRMPLPDGSCECGHGPHVRVGDTIGCDTCNAEKMAAMVNRDPSVTKAESRKWKRSNYVAAPAFFQLNQACRFINDALGRGFGCYLVGSSLHKRDYRDVDVRCILEDAEFDRMFRVEAKDADSGRACWLNPLWSLMCTSISLWLSQQTGLQVDFQIQRQTQANAQHDGPRHALGIFMDYPGERPSDLKVEERTPTFGVWCEQNEGFWHDVVGAPLQTTRTEAERIVRALNEYSATRTDSVGWRYESRPYPNK